LGALLTRLKKDPMTGKKKRSVPRPEEKDVLN